MPFVLLLLPKSGAMKMRRTLSLLATILALPAAAQDRAATDESAIVVTGQSLSSTKAQLDACLARRCPPREDIEASLAHAENQFVAGDYPAARRTLGQSRGRNRRFAATLPVEVADLNRAYGRMNNLDGRPDMSRLAQIEAVDALRAGLDDKDSRILAQRLMVGDEFARVGRLRGAEEVYNQVAREARKTRQFDMLGHALFRDAVVTGSVASVRPNYRSAAERKIARIENSREPELASFRDAARLLRANIAGQRGDLPALEKAIAAMAPQKSGTPVLIYAPPILSAPAQRLAIPSSGGEAEWIDLRFRVAADGRVHDVETLRVSGNVDSVWPKLVEQSVSARRYAPLALPRGSDGAVRIERFAYVHDLTRETGSRIVARLRHGRITSLDLTQDPRPAS
jgi:hypothetical protein